MDYTNSNQVSNRDGHIAVTFYY